MGFNYGTSPEKYTISDYNGDTYKICGYIDCFLSSYELTTIGLKTHHRFCIATLQHTARAS